MQLHPLVRRDTSFEFEEDDACRGDEKKLHPLVRRDTSLEFEEGDACRDERLAHVGQLIESHSDVDISELRRETPHLYSCGRVRAV